MKLQINWKGAINYVLLFLTIIIFSSFLFILGIKVYDEYNICKDKGYEYYKIGSGKYFTCYTGEIVNGKYKITKFEDIEPITFSESMKSRIGDKK